MNKHELADKFVEQMGGGLIEDAFGGAIKKAFPNASRMDLYGAGIQFHADGSMELTCAGETVCVPAP